MKLEDIEKADSSSTLECPSQSYLDKTASNSFSNDSVEKPDLVPQSRWQRWIASLKNVESSGIEPVPINKREPITPSTILHMLLRWFSMTLATNNIIVGSMGTLVLGLSYRDAALCAVFGCLAGNFTVGFISIWGPKSGNRTLVRIEISVIHDTRERRYFIRTDAHALDRSWPDISWVITPAKFALS